MDHEDAVRTFQEKYPGSDVIATEIRRREALLTVPPFLTLGFSSGTVAILLLEPFLGAASPLLRFALLAFAATVAFVVWGAVWLYARSRSEDRLAAIEGKLERILGLMEGKSRDA